MVLFEILASVVIVSLVSLVGILTIFFREKTVEDVLFLLISLSAGALLGAAFLDLIPESIEIAGVMNTMWMVIVGFLLFFVLEKFLLFHHAHDHSHAKKHSGRKAALPYLNLIGDGIHNLVDGMIIAVAYITDPSLGIVTTIAIIAHEIPQEIGDFGVLIYGGLNKWNALAFNFLTALTAIIGAMAIILLNVSVESITTFLLPLAAGHFIYISTVDIMPELHKTTNKTRSVMQLAFILLGMLFIVSAGALFGHA